ncbi:hypothetical protein FGO68_gene6051 [Halteria grandinella]|uniref:Uncharacterized protein n=1 Tax=Halteria grandinella TaxID=5974 RepID=A0A8J8NJF6_HALGN|nr:hypothetical protein FGO68_gene6051 [Halteria grandinella]
MARDNFIQTFGILIANWEDYSQTAFLTYFLLDPTVPAPAYFSLVITRFLLITERGISFLYQNFQLPYIAANESMAIGRSS